MARSLGSMSQLSTASPRVDLISHLLSDLTTIFSAIGVCLDRWFLCNIIIVFVLEGSFLQSSQPIFKILDKSLLPWPIIDMT